jgi:hypothetical protein
MPTRAHPDLSPSLLKVHLKVADLVLVEANPLDDIRHT